MVDFDMVNKKMKAPKLNFLKQRDLRKLSAKELNSIQRDWYIFSHRVERSLENLFKIFDEKNPTFYKVSKRQ